MAVACATALGITLAGCGGEAGTGSGDKLAVVASFYPLQFIAERVGGDAVRVTTLTAPGAEPHDLELTPQQVGSISEAKVVLYEKHVQPAVDEAVSQNAEETGFDISPAVNLVPTGAHAGGHESERADGEHQDEEHQDGEDAPDPHFWLDPQRYADAVTAVADRFAQADSAHADDYRQRAATLRDELAGLDGEFTTGLRTCKLRTFVTSHEAFAYLAKRYGLEMIGIAGFTPDAEPTPARRKEVQELVARRQVTTIFAEELASAKAAESIAGDLKVRTAVLSPVEGLSAANSSDDYFSLMRKNLHELRKANGCS